jgi:hypothetical protein
MKTLVSAAALVAALSMGGFLPAGAHMGGMSVGGGSAIRSAQATGAGGISFHGFGRRGVARFHSAHFRFGNFGPRRTVEFAGAYGDYADGVDDAYGAYDDDIDNLHFRVQEPFGPGDVGRPAVGAEPPFISDRMDPRDGYEPQD